MTSARALSDRLAHLLHLEHAALGDFLVALAEFDRARAWVELGHASLWAFLHRELGLSAGAAFQRKVAAGLLQRFPGVEAPLRDGRLRMSSVVELARVLTAENEAAVLPRFFHLSAREAREVVAELAPREDAPVRTVVTSVETGSALPVTAPFHTSEVVPGLVAGDEARPAVSVELEAPTPTSTPASTATATATGTPTGTPTATPTQNGAPTTPRPVMDTVEPLTADLRRLHVTVSKRLLAKLEAARDGLSHAIPGASTEQVLEAALDALLAKQASRKGLVKRPRAPAATASAGPRPAAAREQIAGVGRGRARISAEVKREVWTRDGGRCQWPLEAGGVCGATRSLELDHLVPLARGGPTTAANLRVLCRFHNQLAARQALGDAFIDRFAAGR